ncbi:MAG: protein kinase [Gammaproteobacteria bacterium]|nr:protein kinase [Gammaproteobacteria bacterium]
MESQKWRRIEEIFEAAVEKPPALRAAFLDARCEGDATVRAEVESLLRADDQSGDFLAGIFDGAGERAGVIAKDAVIGPYRIVERIAEGGMGVVYKAFDTRLERDVALKFLANSTGLSDPGHQRFLLEAKAASSLDHPSICTIHDIGQTGDGHTYIVMPYYVGRTLEHLLRDGPLPLSSAVWFALQVADGLSKAHHQGIWHRDLKPANLIVSPDERLTILDFGIAKMRGMELTSAGVRLGTLAYMAPEQLRAEDVDQRADIWALGSILFEMLVGRRVFVADRDHRLMYAILEEPIPSLSQHLTDCPPELNALVAKAVQRDREDRFGSMHEMHEVLVRCYNELGRGAAVPIPIARPVASPAVVAPREQENVSVNSLMSWLVELGLERYAAVFEAAEVDEETIVELEESDLIDLGIPVGPRKKLLRAMPELVTWNAERNSQMETQLALTRAGSDTAGRRQITVMFCDLVESTALSRVLDPEDLRDLLDAYERAGMAVIERYDGHVAQRLGDGLLVYFGYPRAHEDDPERAVSAGLDIIRSVRALDVRPDLELRTRVGIATGEVVISRSDGSTGAPETAVGEAPNLASRLLDIASPDTVVIAQNTRDRVAELFEYADLGAHELRGYAEPVRAWHVTGARAEYDRFTALRGVRASTPTVGREDEFELLRRRWSQAKAGNGQVVILSGQPGIGKSKLVGTLRDSVADDQTVLLRYYGSPYHANTVLHPVAEQIAAVSGLRAEDRPGEKLDKVEQLLGRMGIDMPEAGSLLASLLNIEPGERYARVERSPARQRALTLDMLEAQLATLSARQPVLFIFEDLHWVDATSIDLLTQLIEHLREQRVMMLLTCRPEFTPPWLDEAHVSLAPCKRLTQEESYALLEEIAGEEKLPSELMKQVVDRADGVPLFLEELTAAVLGSDLPSESTTSTLTSGAYARVVPGAYRIR